MMERWLAHKDWGGKKLLDDGVITSVHTRCTQHRHLAKKRAYERTEGTLFRKGAEVPALYISTKHAFTAFPANINRQTHLLN